MGKVVLFAVPKVGPELPRFPTEQELPFGEISRWVDDRTREKVAVLVSVLGLTHLTELCVDCALSEIIKLCERPDVYAVLDAFQKDKAAAKRRRA
jgi:hypothetical protein